jgi:hypothetical protein
MHSRSSNCWSSSRSSRCSSAFCCRHSRVPARARDERSSSRRPVNSWLPITCTRRRIGTTFCPDTPRASRPSMMPADRSAGPSAAGTLGVLRPISATTSRRCIPRRRSSTSSGARVGTTTRTSSVSSRRLVSTAASWAVTRTNSPSTPASIACGDGCTCRSPTKHAIRPGCWCSRRPEGRDPFSPGGYDPELGYHVIRPPYWTSAQPAWEPYVPGMDMSRHGNVDLRWRDEAVCAMFDGHVENLGDRELRDMTRWSNDATRADWHLTPSP